MLIDQGINSMAELAFAFGQPGDAPSDPELRNLLANGGDPAAIPIGTVSSLRRLVFECMTLMVNQVKLLFESKEDDSKYQLGPAERTDRLRRQKARLPH